MPVNAVQQSACAYTAACLTFFTLSSHTVTMVCYAQAGVGTRVPGNLLGQPPRRRVQCRSCASAAADVA